MLATVSVTMKVILYFVTLLVLGLGQVYGGPLEEFELLRQQGTDNTKNNFTNEIQAKIVNGQRAELGQFPWQALLILEGHTYKNGMKTLPKTENICGASLISKQYLITAAHCVLENDRRKNNWKCTNINVELGSIRKGKGVFVNTKEYYVHPKWDSHNLLNDIAVVRIPVPYDRIKGYNPKLIAPISLPAFGEKYEDFVGQNAIASGFGITQFGDTLNDDLYYATLKVIDNKRCSKRFPYTLLDGSKICTSSDKIPPSSACSGDSGGPLVINDSLKKPILIGVASFVEFGCTGLSVFTKINSYMDFICQYATDVENNCR